MPQFYRTQAESLHKHKTQTSSTPNYHFNSLSQFSFIQYRHAHCICNRHANLKKKKIENSHHYQPQSHSRQCCCQKQEIKKETPTIQPPTIIKQIRTVLVPSPPNMIRELRQAVPVMHYQPITQVHTRTLAHSPSPSTRKVSFNYLSPPKTHELRKS